jgi:uncharacterized protein YbjT (DUF2867 family)
MPGAAAIFGATGLVGSACLDLMLEDERYTRVISIGRRAPACTDAKLVVHRVALDAAEALDDPMLGSVDEVFCCLGTTIAKAGSQEAFRRVDFDYVVNAARFTKRRSARRFLMVTAVGADANSRVFCSRVKGEAEEAVAKLGIESVSILRVPDPGAAGRVSIERAHGSRSPRLARTIKFVTKGMPDVKIRQSRAFGRYAARGRRALKCRRRSARVVIMGLMVGLMVCKRGPPARRVRT